MRGGAGEEPLLQPGERGMGSGWASPPLNSTRGSCPRDAGPVSLSGRITCCICLRDARTTERSVAETLETCDTNSEGGHSLASSATSEDDLGVMVHLTSCKHFMHSGCLVRWVRGKDVGGRVCPLCRATILEEDVMLLRDMHPHVLGLGDRADHRYVPRVFAGGDQAYFGGVETETRGDLIKSACHPVMRWGFVLGLLGITLLLWKNDSCAPLPQQQKCLREFYPTDQGLTMLHSGLACDASPHFYDNIGLLSRDPEGEEVLTLEQAMRAADPVAVETARAEFGLKEPTQANLMQLCRQHAGPVTSAVANKRMGVEANGNRTFWLAP